MNSFKNLYLFILLSTLNNIYCQNRTAYNQIQIEVSDKMTTHLIFNEDIDYVDLGANEFSTDKLKNVLKIKCTDLNKWNIQDKTNLTVITKGGNYYSIWITYQINPKIKTYIYLKIQLLPTSTNKALPQQTLSGVRKLSRESYRQQKLFLLSMA